LKGHAIEDKWAVPLRRLLLEAFVQFYGPLLSVFPKENTNPREQLEHAFHIGNIRYVGGVFVGQIPAEISLYLKEHGAIWDYQARGWRLPLTALPVRVALIAERYAKKDDDAKKLITAALALAPVLIDAFLSGPKLVEIAETITEKATTSAGLTPAPDTPIPAAATPFDIRVRDIMQKTTKKEINKILLDMDKVTQKGGDLESYITARSLIAESKAKAIARSEMAKESNIARAKSYIAEGSPFYMWQSMEDASVRRDHVKLDKTVQRWDNPPIVDTRTGFRGHPQEAANCRCIAIPLRG